MVKTTTLNATARPGLIGTGSLWKVKLVPDYHCTLRATWISLEGCCAFAYALINPRFAAAPFGLKIPELPSPLFGCGGTKLAWLAMSKNSARNWMLNASDMRAIGKTLWTEKSMLTRRGPVTQVRPRLNGTRLG